MNVSLHDLNRFLGKAALITYAGDGRNAEIIQRPGFIELEYAEGPYYYRDSYAGFFTSAGQETIWLNKQPLWIQSYGGGMVERYRGNKQFAVDTFTFLKKALSHGEKIKAFQPRGEKKFIVSHWTYQANWSGDITEFQGDERILYQDQVVFTHFFGGGLFKWM